MSGGLIVSVRRSLPKYCYVACQRFSQVCYWFKKFFCVWCGPFLKSLLNVLQCCFCFPFCILGLKVCEILAFPPGTPCTGRGSLNHWTTRQVPILMLSKYRSSYFYINKFRIFLPSWSVPLLFYIENARKSELCCSSGKDFQWKA